MCGAGARMQALFTAMGASTQASSTHANWRDSKGVFTPAAGAVGARTRGDLHGLADVRAVQLPQQHELAGLQCQNVLLLVLAGGHAQLLAVQGHCAERARRGIMRH